MKKLLVLSLMLSGIILSTHAAVRTVSNNTTRPAQYTTFAAAQTASANGDTIYIHGSPFTYPDITVSKKLVIIGSGYNPNNQFGQPTNINGIILFRDSGSSNATGTVIMGVLCGRLDVSGLMSDDIRIFRCRFTNYMNLTVSSTYADGWILYNNIFHYYIYGGANTRTSASPTNIIIANNIFTSGGFLYGFNSSNIIIDHNIFFGSNVFLNTFNIIATNNIFTRATGTVFSTSGGPVLCTFNKNLSNQSTIADPASYTPSNNFVNTFTGAGGGSNFGGGNIIGLDPLYTTAPILTEYVATSNYRLQATSPGKSAGTDGTDLGIYGGAYPFPSGGAVGSGYDTSPMPAIPQVTELNILNATVPVNGTLNVNVKATVNN